MSSEPKSDSETGGVTTPPEPIAIIGIGCMFPKAKDLENYWANIREGVDGITETPKTHWRTEDYYDANPDAPDKTYGRRGGFLEQTDFDPMEFGIAPRDVEATDTAQLLGMAIAKQALMDAGYSTDAPDLPRDRISVVLGVTGTLELVIPLGARLGHPIWRRALKDAGVDPTTAEDVVERIRDSYVGWQENSFPGLLGNVVAGRIANRLDLHGTNCVVDSACASSLSALHLAVMELQAGRADMVVTGGVDTFNDIFMYMCFSKTPALSPTGDAKPFAANGDGTILGEGIGMVVLKRLSEAERDDDRIYAVIRGIGSSSDGKGNAVYAPSSEGQARALRNAYENAAVDPSTIELVEAHGTGTKVGDATEIRGLTSVFSAAKREGSWCALGSVKSMIGHTKAAAGAAGLIKAAMALHHRVLPPTLKVDSPNDAAAPGTTPFYVNTQLRPWLPARHHPRRAGVSAFGFGGSNFHCVLEEYAPDKAQLATEWDGRVQILPIAAHDRDGLHVVLEDLRVAFADIKDWSTVRGVAARARQDFDPKLHCRLVLLLEADRSAPIAQITTAGQLLEQHGDAEQWSSPQGIWFATGPKTGEIAAIFPGQGSQYPGMLRELLCQFPCAQEALANANAGGQSTELSDHVYPHPAFDEDTRRRQADALRQTDVAQPAIGAVSLGAWNVLQNFGVQVAATAGHSYGELAALRAAGRLSEVDFHTLSWFRGKFMARGDGDRGRMLAVFAEHAVVEQFLERHDLDVVLANRNAPNQCVLSGASKAIEQAERQLQEDGVRCKLLPVAAAFHSALVAEATAPFGELLSDVEFADGNFPVYANTSAQPYPSDAAAARRLLAGQLARPVEFQRCVENMRKAGITTFVETGPGNTMSGLVSATLEGDPKVWTTSIDGSHGRGRADLARTLACLVAGGHHVDLELWDAGYLQRHNARLSAKRPAYTVPISGANYVVPRELKPPRPARPPAVSVQPVPTEPRQDLPASPRPAAPTAHEGMVSDALRANQESLEALAKLQQQTAELHRRFLENQEQAARNLEQLLARQQSGFGTGQLGDAFTPASPLSVPKVATPVPMTEDATPVLLDVVAEKTGYPVDMLELSMGLDSDLGIDSIKRVEILSALQD
ncbi:MAG: beta-ketoacyl synthase N-terminal-like domain-containing protein, partial [Planctomycetota bacterium]|nr:beta-ketoacyl synthase N-terminal-like domain-containing protein [Planctomycetota bacterium]